MGASIRFSGAAGTVTGSHHLIDIDGARLLLDAGLFQGGRALRDRNWQPFPVPPASINAVMLSHAHIDHTGYLPRLVRDGFRGPVLATPGTRDLCAIMLPDSGRLQEEEAEFRNRKVGSRHNPALPLYTEQDAERAVQRIRGVEYHTPHALPGGATLTFLRAGHILGSSLVKLDLNEGTVLFSGDLGRTDPPLLRPADPPPAADWVLIESTYGDRLHQERDPRPGLTALVRRVAERRGVLVIPAFAVGRTQEVLHMLRVLEDAGDIPELPVVVDSPMAVDATRLLMQYPEELDTDVRVAGERAIRPRKLRFSHSVEDSKKLNTAQGPMIIISASGMATGGRILHHLRHRLPDARNAILLVGYQGEGTRGRMLLEGADKLRIFHEDVRVRAEIVSVDSLSAHADADDLVDWLKQMPSAPRCVYLVHGEDDARAGLAARINRTLGWKTHAPAMDEHVDLP